MTNKIKKKFTSTLIGLINTPEGSEDFFFFGELLGDFIKIYLVFISTNGTYA